MPRLGHRPEVYLSCFTYRATLPYRHPPLIDGQDDTTKARTAKGCRPRRTPNGVLHLDRLTCRRRADFLISPSAMATHPKIATGVGPGGRRDGAGRPRGARGKRNRSRELLAQIKADGLEMPVDRLLRRMNDRELPEEYRDELARAVAPYTAPRLSIRSPRRRGRRSIAAP